MAIGLFGPERLQYSSGGPAVKTQVYVFLPGTVEKAVLYADPDALTTAANPTWTDHMGELTFFAELGSYDLWVNDVRLPVVVDQPATSGGVTEDELIAVTRYKHVQSSPLSVWTIAHPLGYEPAGVRVIQTTNEEIYGSVSYPNPNTVRIAFSAPTAGIAYLS